MPVVKDWSYFPHWKEKTSGVIMPEERLPWWQTIVSGLQHGVTMAGATIIAPVVMGFDPNLAPGTHSTFAGRSGTSSARR